MLYLYYDLSIEEEEEVEDDAEFEEVELCVYVMYCIFNIVS